MIIRVVGQAGESVFPFGTNGPWLKFKENLISKRDTEATQKFGQKIDALICHGYSKKAIHEANKSKIAKHKMVLVLWEPPIINPKLHSDEYLSNFGQIYAPSMEWAKKHNAIYFKWPVGDTESKFKEGNLKARHNKAVMIQGNKINFLKGENYSLRRAVLFKSLPLKYRIMLYGTEWERLPIRQTVKALVDYLLNFKYEFSKHSLKYIKTKYPYYQGISKNKFTTLEKYKICIVIENHNSYISEKIFDSLNSGCITIYVGPNLENYGLNKNLAIQSDSNPESILNSFEKIMMLSDNDMLKVQKNQRYHLEKIKKNWNNQLVLKTLAKDIRREIKK